MGLTYLDTLHSRLSVAAPLVAPKYPLNAVLGYSSTLPNLLLKRELPPITKVTISVFYLARIGNQRET